MGAAPFFDTGGLVLGVLVPFVAVAAFSLIALLAAEGACARLSLGVGFALVSILTIFKSGSLVGDLWEASFGFDCDICR